MNWNIFLTCGSGGSAFMSDLICCIIIRGIRRLILIDRAYVDPVSPNLGTFICDHIIAAAVIEFFRDCTF